LRGFDAAIKEKSNSIEAYTKRAEIYDRLDKKAEAEADRKKVKELKNKK